MKKAMAALILFLIETLLFYLYEMPLEAWAYSSVFILLIFGGWIILDEVQQRKKYKQLKNIQKEAEVYLETEHFGKPENAVEKEYQNLAEMLGRQWENARQEARCQISEANRYYIRWSHQIKTPIAALRLLLEEEEPDRAAMEGEIYRIEQYVEFALQYQRLEGGHKDLVFAHYSLESIVKKALKKTGVLFSRTKLALELGNLQTDVLTDEKWLVFVNTAVDGIRLEAQLQGSHIDACFLYEEDAAAYEELIQQQKSNYRVLIVEARLCSNLSITDPTLKNIVLPFASISSIKQMLQVKQRTPNETVRVYFEDANSEKVLDFLQESIHQSLNVMARAHAGQNDANRFFNLPACYHAYYQICFSLYLLQKMQTDPKQSYIKILLSHLSGKEPSAAVPKINAPQTFQELIEEAKVQLAAYLETLTPLALISPDENGSFDQLQTLKQKINNLHKLVYGRILDDKWKDTSRFFPEAKLNAFLSSLSLPYTIQSNSKNGVRTTIVTNITK